MVAQILKDCEPIHFRHEDIQDDCVWRFFVNYFPSPASTFNEDWFVLAVFAEYLPNQSQVIGIVVNDQNIVDFTIFVQAIKRVDEILFENGFDKIICSAEAESLVCFFCDGTNDDRLIPCSRVRFEGCKYCP